MESKRTPSSEWDCKNVEDPNEVYSFDDAVEKTGTGRFHILLLFTTGIALLSVVLEGLNMAFVLPSAKCEMIITNTEQGLINAVSFMGVVLTSHFWGFLADTWGRRKVLQTALSTSFVFSVLSSLSTNSTMLLVTRLGVGLCVSGVQAAGVSYLGEFHGNKTRAKHVTFAVMFMTVAVVYQGLMGLFIMPSNWEFSLFGLMVIRPWRMYIFIGSCSSAISFLVICFLPESPRFELSMGRKDVALAILRKSYAANGLGLAANFPVSELALFDTNGSNLTDVNGIGSMFQMVWKQTKPLLQKEHLGNVLLMCYLTFSAYAAVYGSYLWYPQMLSLSYPFMDQSITTCQAVSLGYQLQSTTQEIQSTNWHTFEASSISASECDGTSEPMTYYIILVMGCTFLVLYCFVALNVNRIGLKWLLSGWLAISAVATLAILWTNQFYVNIAMATLMYTSANCGNLISAVAADLFPTHFKSMALCIIMMSGRIGAVLGSNFVGAVLDGYCDYQFAVFTVLLTVSVGVCYYVLRKREQVLAKVANQHT